MMCIFYATGVDYFSEDLPSLLDLAGL